MTQRPAGAIVAGGRAVRLGGIAKGLLRVGDSRIIDRVADALRPVVGELLVVTNDPDADWWLPEATVVRDVLTGGGSAAGIHAALRKVFGPVVAVAWDMPFVTRELCHMLAARGAAGGVDAVVPRGVSDDHVEPMCAWYSQACVAPIEATWKVGDRSLHGLLGRVRTEVLDTALVALAGDRARMFFNVNTEADLERARAMVSDDETDVR